MSNAQCYYPNGNEVTAEDAIPCGSGNGVGCCPLNWTCQPNGLCYLANQNYYGRYSCTDQSWQSSGCPQICTYDHTADGDEAILECEPSSYCCDTNRPELSGGQNCCDASSKRFAIEGNSSVDGGMQASMTPMTSAAPTTPTTWAPAAASTTASPAAPSSSIDCGGGPGETPCGTICCAMNQFCNDDGTCASSSAAMTSSSAMATSLSTATAAATSSSDPMPDSRESTPVTSSTESISPTSSPATMSSTPTTSNAIITTSQVDPPTVTTTLIASPSTASSSSASPSTSPVRSKGFKVGLPFGLVGAFAIAVIFLCLRRRRRRRRRPNDPLYGPVNNEPIAGSGTVTPSMHGYPLNPPIPNPYDQIAHNNRGSPALSNRSPLNHEIIPDQDVPGTQPAQPNLQHPPAFDPYRPAFAPPPSAAAGLHQQQEDWRGTPPPPSYRSQDSSRSSGAGRIRRGGLRRQDGIPEM